MNGVDLVLLRERDDRWNVQVRLDRLARLADEIGLVRLEAVQGVAVLMGINGDSPNPQLMGAAKHTDGNLAAIGDEQLGDLRHRDGSDRGEEGWAYAGQPRNGNRKGGDGPNLPA